MAGARWLNTRPRLKGLSGLTSASLPPACPLIFPNSTQPGRTSRPQEAQSFPAFHRAPRRPAALAAPRRPPPARPATGLCPAPGWTRQRPHRQAQKERPGGKPVPPQAPRTRWDSGPPPQRVRTACGAGSGAAGSSRVLMCLLSLPVKFPLKSRLSIPGLP